MSPWWQGRWYTTKVELVAAILTHYDGPETAPDIEAALDDGTCWMDGCTAPGNGPLGLCPPHRDGLAG